MTNRERLLQTNEYDLLIRIQNYIRLHRSCCILDAITGEDNKCHYSCDICIQKWLNEEEGEVKS